MQRPRSRKESDLGASQTVNNPSLIVGAAAFTQKLNPEVSRVIQSDLYMGRRLWCKYIDGCS